MPATLLLRLLLAALLIAGLLGGTTYAQNATYNASQSNYDFRSKHGNFTFNGKAIKREGEYVQFLTSKRIEIWLPVKYLSDESLDYLKYLSGQGPAPMGLAVPPTDPSSESAAGAMANNSGEGSPDASDADGTSTTSDKPVAPTKGDPDRIFSSGTPIEVLVDGTWVPAKLFARRPSDNAYYVSYIVGGRPKTVWTPADEIRVQGEGEPTSEEPMAEDPMDDSSPDESASSDMS